MVKEATRDSHTILMVAIWHLLVRVPHPHEVLGVDFLAAI
jgi:hypothetical protein